MRVRFVKGGTVKCAEEESPGDCWVMGTRGQRVEDRNFGIAVSDKVAFATALSLEARTLPLVRWGC